MGLISTIALAHIAGRARQTLVFPVSTYGPDLRL
jgi:hypothetical protein